MNAIALICCLHKQTSGLLVELHSVPAGSSDVMVLSLSCSWKSKSRTNWELKRQRRPGTHHLLLPLCTSEASGRRLIQTFNDTSGPSCGSNMTHAPPQRDFCCEVPQTCLKKLFPASLMSWNKRNKVAEPGQDTPRLFPANCSRHQNHATTQIQ